jgi:glycosyltransferase involved in cell wall biosynthesis
MPVNNINISLIGFFLSPNGLGQAARNIAHSLETTSLPFNCVNIDHQLPKKDNEFINKCSKYTPNQLNLVISGLDLTDRMLNEISNLGSGKKNYLYPFWELDRIPAKFLKAISTYDCVVAPSQFIADTFQKYLDYKVPVIHQPVIVPKHVDTNEMKDGVLRIFSMMDFTSFISRKNPQAILDCFQKAFPENIKNVQLILKIKGDRDLGFRNELRLSFIKDRRISVIDGNLDRADIDSLINNCNVFLSLHRSEGFGFGPAEAMASGKIVVATQYGGVTDFLNESTGYPISYKLVPVLDGEYIYSENQLWADPSIQHAVLALQDIYTNFNRAVKLSNNGRQLIINKFSFTSAGKNLQKFFDIN